MDIQTKLTYLQWQQEYSQTRPYRISQFGRKRAASQQSKPHNLVFHKPETTEIIHDIRGYKEGRNEFTLEANGFTYCKHPPPVFTEPKDFSVPKQVQAVFLPECEAILRNEIENVEKVLIFDCKTPFSREIILELL
ncbi:uncharacterized protein N7483_011659 [Penicillium malachiteum]|uniref:uncharacterized protein n=1 Tax=Penicillium malachiteum TaxID=1324776 RepID=UPI002548CC75|nr:uncharacterized protein N7483_011659 [Penicillium malachiteum]KAJ5714478.1 hypothetical protein N7483_011659 [Penicillium malachiteum]